MMQIQFHQGMLVQENDEKMKTTSTNYAVLRRWANLSQNQQPWNSIRCENVEKCYRVVEVSHILYNGLGM